MIKFFKAKSRLGLLNFPNGTSDKNVGVENAPDYILSEEFLSELKHKHEVFEFEFTKPEDIDGDYLETIKNESVVLENLIVDNSNTKDLQITIGGDHSISFGTFLAILKKFNDQKIGFIQIDSHADIHLKSTSPSGNYHGMYLRPVFDKFDYEPIDNLYPNKQDPKNLMYIGNLDIEEEEIRFIDENKVNVISKDDIENKLSNIKKFINKFDHIHLGIDVDAFDKSLVTATGIVAENGLLKEDVFPILEIVKKEAKSLSIDLVEVNPFKQGAKETIELSQNILKVLI